MSLEKVLEAVEALQLEVKESLKVSPSRNLSQASAKVGYALKDYQATLKAKKAPKKEEVKTEDQDQPSDDKKPE